MVSGRTHQDSMDGSGATAERSTSCPGSRHGPDRPPQRTTSRTGQTGTPDPTSARSSAGTPAAAGSPSTSAPAAAAAPLAATGRHCLAPALSRSSRPRAHRLGRPDAAQSAYQSSSGVLAQLRRRHARSLRYHSHEDQCHPGRSLDAQLGQKRSEDLPQPTPQAVPHYCSPHRTPDRETDSQSCIAFYSRLSVDRALRCRPPVQLNAHRPGGLPDARATNGCPQVTP